MDAEIRAAAHRRISHDGRDQRLSRNATGIPEQRVLIADYLLSA
jgi:hypothetical protein